MNCNPFILTKPFKSVLRTRTPPKLVAKTNQISTVVPARCVCIRGDFVPQVPKLFVGDILHALLKDLYWRPHSPNHTGAYDALCEFQVMKAEKLQPLIEVKHAFCHVVQAKELFMPAIDIGGGQALAASVVPEKPRLFWARCAAAKEIPASPIRCRVPVRPE